MLHASYALLRAFPAFLVRCFVHTRQLEQEAIKLLSPLVAAFHQAA